MRAASAAQNQVVDVEDVKVPGLTMVPNWSIESHKAAPPRSCAARFSDRLMVDCEASAAPALRTAPDRKLHQR